MHYPLTLQKLIVEMPEQVLKVRTWAPPLRPEIYLSDLSVSEGDVLKAKRTARE